MSKTTAFDLASIDTIAACNKATEIEITNPATGVGTGVFISVIGRDSDVYRSRIKAMANENIQREATGRRKTDTIDALEAKNIGALVAATVSWRNVVLDGEALECTPENVRTVYKRILPVREQVQEAVNDIASFLQT
jgi:hypothetical protein